MFDPIIAVSPLDGRYKGKTQDLADYFSEFALFKYRTKVEVEWFIFLCNTIKLSGTRVINEEEIKFIREIESYFDITSAKKVKHIESETNHDVKAVEYYLKEALSNSSLSDLSEYIHFGCTSEDINNTAYALMLKSSRDKVATEYLRKIIEKTKELAERYASNAMLSLTHGQTASPTTVGKEFANVAARLDYFYEKIQNHQFKGKFNGATGNFNAHYSAVKTTDWIKYSQDFLKVLELDPNLMTTQIEPHDNTIEYLLMFSQINVILIDFSRDIWQYISRSVFTQKLKAGEIGSSTMPHKVNPIDFENAEGNLGLSNSLIYHLAQKLPISRMQRDLSDSTVLRNLGTVFAYDLIAFQSLLKGLDKIELNPKNLLKELQDNPEVLAEAIQTVMRLEGIERPYEKLKELTRGRRITLEEIREFIQKLELNEKTKQNLLELSPETYTGLATELTNKYLKNKL